MPAQQVEEGAVGRVEAGVGRLAAKRFCRLGVRKNTMHGPRSVVTAMRIWPFGAEKGTSAVKFALSDADHYFSCCLPQSGEPNPFGHSNIFWRCGEAHLAEMTDDRSETKIAKGLQGGSWIWDCVHMLEHGVGGHRLPGMSRGWQGDGAARPSRNVNLIGDFIRQSEGGFR